MSISCINSDFQAKVCMFGPDVAAVTTPGELEDR